MLQVLVRDNLKRAEGQTLQGSHFVPNAAAAVVVAVVAAWRHQGAHWPIVDLWGGVSVSGSNVGRARRGQRGRMGGGTVCCAQLSDTLWSWSPLSKTCIVLQKEHCSSMYCTVVHLISEKTEHIYSRHCCSTTWPSVAPGHKAAPHQYGTSCRCADSQNGTHAHMLGRSADDAGIDFPPCETELESQGHATLEQRR